MFRTAAFSIATLFASTSLLTAPALAQDSGDDAIVVTAHRLTDVNLMAGSQEIEGDELDRVNAPQIGEVLARLPGVSATSFAPGASRPVLRGLGGDRVRVLVDGIGSIDASSVSADHGVSLDTLTIDHVDVLHGPATLVYGGQAIGGAVNAYDKRIPREVPEDGFDLTVLGGFDSVSDGVSAAGSLDVALAPRLVAHLDANWHDAKDQRVGGHVLSPRLRADVLAAAQDLLDSGDAAAAADAFAAADQTGRLPNSFVRGTGFGAGLAFIDEGGSVGVSVQRLDSTYGLPARPLAGESGISIDLGQTRADLRAGLNLDGFLEQVELRAAYGDYRHAELEGDEIGTTFFRKGIEGRLDLIQSARGGWSGRSGVQFSGGKLTVIGDEAILPDNQDERIGLFTLQTLKLGQITLDAALRHEDVRITANPVGFARSFSLQAAALGLAWEPQTGLKFGANFSHGERAPSAEELLSDGVHVATQSYERGDSTFGVERSNGGELFVRYDARGTKLSLTGFLTDFSGFITPIPTGAIVDDVPEFAYRQVPARFAGFELEASQQLGTVGPGTLTLEAGADYVHARIKGAGPVPNIPPLRVQGGIEYKLDTVTLRGELEWNAAQNRVGPYEYPTGAFTLLGANVTWKALGEDSPLTLILAGENLLDVDGRRAASVTRDFVPIAGRNIRLVAKLSF